MPLGRQSLSGSLAFIYDQLPDTATGKPPARLNISTERPTYLAFEVQPVQDIGGTLTVALTMPQSLVSRRVGMEMGSMKDDSTESTCEF